jgi:hypothetical protein
VPFGFLRRSKESPAAADQGGGRSSGRRRGVPFEALTEEWRLAGVMDIDGRLTDALNKREPIPIREVRWAPIDGTSGFEAAPGLRSVDPYDLIVVLAGDTSLPPLTDAERVAHKVHKIAYDVALELPPYRVVGTVFLYPGSEPERLLDRATEMFVPVTDAQGEMAGREVTEPDTEVVLVNRFYLRGVEQIDKRTGERPPRLPGQPLGGISWQDRSR